MRRGVLRRDEAAARLPSSVKACVNCPRATALSKGTMGMSPQSMISAQLEYGLMLARGLKPRKDVCRLDAWRMARGPKRAPLGGCQRPMSQKASGEAAWPGTGITWPVADCRVERRPDDGDIVALARSRQALDMLQVRERANAREAPLPPY